jgi:hypothetical protein
MHARITYKMRYLPHPWNETRRTNGVKVWCLVKVVAPEHGPHMEHPVALFDYDLEAELFQAHVYGAGLDGPLVELDSNVRELFQLRASTSGREKS